MSKLDTFTETTVSDNRMLMIPDDKIDDIIIGATCTHIFSLGFRYSTYVRDSEIIYKQGLNVVLTKLPNDYYIEETEDGRSFVTVSLTPDETLRFKETPLDTFVQMKIININGETLYNVPNKLIVKKPLDIGD